MPVYWFGLSQAASINTNKAIWVGVLLHLFVYPASNAYNSYFDKDEGSIGGLENPPPVSPILFRVAWGIDLLAILLAFLFVNHVFALGILLYGLMSKAYSHPAVRLKSMPFLSWFIVGFFQGAVIYVLTVQAVQDLTINQLFDLKLWFPAMLSSSMLWAVYPMTQIYQHEEDARRGDITMSIKLGIIGTFIFTGVVFMVAFGGFFFYLPINQFFMMLVLTSPVTIFFLNWLLKTWKDAKYADFKHTMWLNILASLGLNIFYVYVLISNHF
jgi:hypothetical protein